MNDYRIKDIKLKFKDVYNSLQCLVLEINTSNATCSISVNYNFLIERDLEIKNVYNTCDSNIEALRSQQQLLSDSISQMLIDAKKEQLDDLKGMLCLLLNEQGTEARAGEKVVSIKVLPQQLITLNGKSYYELDEVVNKMLNV
jgi:hypothetical protein